MRIHFLATIFTGLLLPIVSYGQNLSDLSAALDVSLALQSEAPVTPAADNSNTADPPIGQASSETDRGGLLHRSFHRILQDEKGIYLAPFRPSNFKWDVLVLAPTVALLATDHRIERNLPSGHMGAYSNMSNITIGTLGGTLGGLWAYGIKTGNDHLKETGALELETLSDTFLVYLPLQLLAARQRPGVGNGDGDFWRNHSINTSFPAGHPMFAMAMATVVAHEYPKTWVKVLAYGSVAAVSAGRLLAHDHWASDELIGVSLGYFIGSHIFHTRCKPELNEACNR